MKRFIPLGIIFLAVILLFYPTLTVYFSQDDFFMFKVSQTDGTFRGFLNLFSIHPFTERGIAFYRPVFRETLHNIYFAVFGLNHIPFRILMLGIHLINISLVYIIVNKIFKDRLLSFFAAFFYGITAANAALLYYLAGGIEAGGATMFALITLILFWTYLKGRRLVFYILSFLAFLLAIFSHEIVAATGGVMFLMFLFSAKKTDSDRLKTLLSAGRIFIPFILATFFLLYIDLVIIGLSPAEPQYEFIFNIKTIINSAVWYFLWALGLPETLIDFVGPGLKLNPTLMRYWGNYYYLIFPLGALSLILMIVCLFYLLIKKIRIFLNRNFWFFLLWFPIGLLPIIFLPGRKSTHYLVFVLPAFWTTVGFLVLNFYREISKNTKFFGGVLTFIIIISLALLSITSVRLLDSTYWAAQRGRIAEKLINEVSKTYPSLPKGAIIFFTNDPNYPFLTKEWGNTSKQASLILNGSDALQLLYKDPTLKVFYEDLGAPPAEFKDDLIYRITAKIN